MSGGSHVPSRRRLLAGLAVLVAAGTLAAAILVTALPELVLAQQEGITRTDLQRHDLSTPAREVIQVLVGFAPGVEFPRHAHPGEEIVYVVEGVLEYRLDGKHR